MRQRNRALEMISDLLGLLIIGFVFIVPFLFILVNSFKERREAGLMRFTLPDVWMGKENYLTVLKNNDYELLRGFINSGVLSVAVILILIFICSMAGYILQRRQEPASRMIQMLILVETALQIPFVTMLYRSYIATIPKEIEEAALLDGCSGMGIYRRVIFPLAKPVTASVIVLTAVTVFNDFVNPLYFLPGRENVTVSLTMYSFMGQYGSDWNLLFADIVLISIPPLILFLIFHKKIVDGVAGTSVKG